MVKKVVLSDSSDDEQAPQVISKSEANKNFLA